MPVSLSLATPRPDARVRIPGHNLRGLPSGGQPRSVSLPPPPPTTPLPLKRVLSEERKPGAPESKPSRSEGLTFNRLDVAMFLQLKLSRDLERTRGASRPGLRRRPEFPAESTGPARGPLRAGAWRASGWGGGGATVLSLSQAPELPHSSPYMVTGASPRAGAHANARGQGSNARQTSNGSRPDLEEGASTPPASPPPSD
jgi:hypothetical protein